MSPSYYFCFISGNLNSACMAYPDVPGTSNLFCLYITVDPRPIFSLSANSSFILSQLLATQFQLLLSFFLSFFFSSTSAFNCNFCQHNKFQRLKCTCIYTNCWSWHKQRNKSSSYDSLWSNIAQNALCPILNCF